VTDRLAIVDLDGEVNDLDAAVDGVRFGMPAGAPASRARSPGAMASYCAALTPSGPTPPS
jgi:hypothetical protein